MSPLEIRRPNGLGTEFCAALQKSGTITTVQGPPNITIGWQEESQTAYVRIGEHAPLEEVPLSPDTTVLIGKKTRVGDKIYCVEHPIQLTATEAIT